MVFSVYLKQELKMIYTSAHQQKLSTEVSSRMESASKGRRSFSLVSFLVWVEVFHILQPLIEISILLEILSNPLEAFLSLIGCNEEPNRATTMESKEIQNPEIQSSFFMKIIENMNSNIFY